MIKLFIKDFYLLKRHLWIGIFYSFIIFFTFSSQTIEAQEMVYVMGMTIIGYMMLMYITAYDDKNNSQVLLNSLPVSRKGIVLSRYLSVIIFALYGLLNMIITGFVLSKFNVFNVSLLIRIEELIGALIGLYLLACIYLPIYFKYGYLKAKVFNIAIFAIAFGTPIIIKNIIQDFEKPLWLDNFVGFIQAQSDMGLIIILLGLLLVINFISYSISAMLYNKREF